MTQARVMAKVNKLSPSQAKSRSDQSRSGSNSAQSQVKIAGNGIDDFFYKHIRHSRLVQFGSVMFGSVLSSFYSSMTAMFVVAIESFSVVADR